MSDQNPYPQNPYPQNPQDPQKSYGQNPYGQGGQPGYGYPPPGAQPGYGYPQQGSYPPAPGTYTGDPNAPYGYDRWGRPYSEKSKITAGVLQLLLGTLGIGRFYTGHTGMALGQLFTCGGCGVWALVDGIILLVSDDKTDAQGRVLRG